ncbi:MAG: flagellar basal body rod protein FlgB [Hyphomicrobiaceae bacterium]|nr:flagellar basal body rod protein FlgB [Hyphomicrobiaceae bacterium]
MALSDLPIFSALKLKMQWHQTRQTILAENVANAETPGYLGRDLNAFRFADVLDNQSTASVTTVATNPTHFSVGNTETDGFGPRRMGAFEITPEGNAVVLEDEMMKVASNQMDYQTAASLYSRSLRLLRTALGRTS